MEAYKFAQNLNKNLPVHRIIEVFNLKFSRY